MEISIFYPLAFVLVLLIWLLKWAKGFFTNI